MKQITFLAFLCLALFSCAPSSNSTQSVTQQTQSSEHRPDESAVLWQQTAAEYEALCYQAFNSGIYWLKQTNQEYQNARDLNELNPRAIIMDLDETVLNNSPYNAQLIIDNDNYSSSSWNNWVRLSNAGFVPGAKEFIQQVRNLEIEVFFISNRSTETLDQTIGNLGSLGYEIKTDHILLDETDDGDKAERRAQVMKNYDVVMLVGDNLADFSDVFENPMSVTERKSKTFEFQEMFGNKFIVLPNPMYGKWESTLKEKDPQYPQNNRFEDKRSFLKGYKK